MSKKRVVKPFGGFTLPTYTQFPNQALDAMPDLSGAEFKCLAYVIRNTFGYHERVKVLSLTQFTAGRFKKNRERLDYGTGLNRETVVIALRALVLKGYLVEFITSGDAARAEKAYQLNILYGDEDTQSENPTNPSRKIRPRTEKETVDRNFELPVAPTGATPRAPKATSKTKPPSRLARPVSVPTDEITPEAARIAALPPVTFDDFGGMTDSTADISVTDGLFNAVSELFGVTDVEKKPNSEAGLMVGMLRGNSKLNGQWGQNALPKSMNMTGADLRAWASWWQEQPDNVGLTLPKKPLTLPGALQTWVVKGKPLSYADKAKQNSTGPSNRPAESAEEAPLTEAERQERLRQLKEMRERRGK